MCSSLKPTANTLYTSGPREETMRCTIAALHYETKGRHPNPYRTFAEIVSWRAAKQCSHKPLSRRHQRLLLSSPCLNNDLADPGGHFAHPCTLACCSMKAIRLVSATLLHGSSLGKPVRQATGLSALRRDCQNRRHSPADRPCAQARQVARVTHTTCQIQ